MRSAAVDYAPSQAERRNFQRVRVKIYGRFMLEDRTEHPCQVVDMSPGNVALRTDRIGMPGEKVIAYIDHIGRIEGVVTRTLQDGFAMTVIASDRKKDKLAAQLTWLANKHELGLPEDRRHDRLMPRNTTSELTLDDGTVHICRIMDLSLSGAAVDIEIRPTIGTPVRLGNMRGRVIRHFMEGVAIEFLSLQSRETLREFL